MDLYDDDLIKLLKAFDTNGVLYLIVGGFAVNKYGYKRATGDIDIYLKDDLPNRRRLVEALEDLGYGHFEPLLTAPILAGYCEIMMDNGMYADLMTDIPGLQNGAFEQYRERASINNMEGVPIWYISYNDLIENKKSTARNKDLLDIQELEKLQGPGDKQD